MRRRLLPAQRSRETLVLFLKAPRLGAVKRRLAAGIGPVAALAFYRRSAAHALALARDSRWRALAAVTPDSAVHGPVLRGLGAPVPMIPQGRGDLGARMANCFRKLAPSPVIIVGGDIPGITAAHITRAFRLLRAHDAVIGPATDGGFWLIGLRRAALAPVLFRNVRWSSAHALADVRANLPTHAKIAFAETLEDVDEEKAYRRFLERARGFGLRAR